MGRHCTAAPLCTLHRIKYYQSVVNFLLVQQTLHIPSRYLKHQHVLRFLHATHILIQSRNAIKEMYKCNLILFNAKQNFQVGILIFSFSSLTQILLIQARNQNKNNTIKILLLGFVSFLELESCGDNNFIFLCQKIGQSLKGLQQNIIRNYSGHTVFVPILDAKTIA